MKVTKLAALGAVMGMCVLGGCAGADSDVAESAPPGEVLGTATSALSNGSVQWINGTYTNCVNKTGSWSARVSGVAPMDNPALSVVQNDNTCVLTVTGVYADQAYAATPSIVLGTSYAATASFFGTGAAQFTANAKLDSNQFAADFQISLVYGDISTTPTNHVVNSAYATVQASTVATYVAAPNYSINVSGLQFQLDALKIITSVGGTATLTDGSVTGSQYAIDMGTLPANPTYAQVQLAYTAAILTQKPISGANPTVNGSQFNVVGLSLLGGVTQVRTLIVQRSVAGVAAYQLFRITFQS